MARTTLPRVPDPLRAGLRPCLRLLAVSAVALATANCSTNPQKLAAGPAGSTLDPKYGVKASPRLYNEGDAIPKGGGRRFSGKPYVVAGRTYVPREDARGYVREGEASWYGSAFHGRMTANGEVFDRHAIVAAHPTLPLPSYARVTNTSNGYSMVVRVNDRGPYHANRVMDVSEEVAHALSFHNRGTTHVRVEYIGKASVAGSDDRKLMATLRTDGRPASGGRGPVMLADLGPSDEAGPERFAKPARAPLAFRPEPESEPEEAPRPQRPPVMLARAAVSVPAAVQPTAPRAAAFRPVAVAGLNPAEAARPGSASRAGFAAKPGLAAKPGFATATGPAAGAGARMAAAPLQPTRSAPVRAAATRLAAQPVPAAMPVSAKLAIARLAAVPAAPSGAKPAPAGQGAPAGRVAAHAGGASAPAPKGAAPAARVASGPGQKPAAPHRGDRLAGIY